MKLIATPQVLVVSMVEARDGLLWPAQKTLANGWAGAFSTLEDVYAGNAHVEAQHHGIAECTTDDAMWIQSVKHHLDNHDGYGCTACEVEEGNAIMIAPMPAEPVHTPTPMREFSYNEALPLDAHGSLNVWREVTISDCEFGCKVYQNRDTDEKVVAHNSNYGCKR